MTNDELTKKMAGATEPSDASPESSTNNHLPRIYVASLADYNAGRLLGKWIDATKSIEEIQSDIAELLAGSPELVAEEWAIHDYENFHGLSLSEFADLERVNTAAQLIVEHGPVFAGLLNHFGGLSGLEEACSYMEDGYRGEFESLAEYAEQQVWDLYDGVMKQLPDFIRFHIDYDGIASDLEISGDIFTVECGGRIHVFDGHQ